jgi:EAL domain-containing protein (putative c-di-GMP-specific phosphodiesterase class I)
VPDRALEVVFEDRFDVRSGEVTGFGTRLRPTDPATRPGPPRDAEFETAVSEDSALAVHLDTWAVEAACEEAARRRVAWPTLVAGVDVSPLSFTRPDFPEMIVDTLARHGLPGAALEIAVHERLARQDPVGLSVRAEALRAAGVRIALSGMGAPDAALAALPGLPLDALRVGEELTRHRTEEQARTFVAALVGFADALGLTVVAQGARDGTAPAAGPVECRGDWPGVSPRPATPGAHT